MKKGKILSGILSCATLTSMASFYANAGEAIDKSQITVPEITGTICGDVNLDGRIGLQDAILLNKSIAKSVLLNETAKKNADCNADDYLNSEDTLSLLRYLVSLTDELPEIPQDYVKELALVSKIDAIGYTDELFHLSNSENSSAVITSCAELEAYLTPITQAETVQMYLSKYDDMFFEKNVLLLNSIYQSCGGRIMYQIDSVSYQGSQLKVKYSDMYEDYQSYPDVVNGLLAQVTVPKEQYQANAVEWIQQEGHLSTGEFTPTSEISSIGYTDALWNLSNSENSSAIITSCVELESYLSTITNTEAIQWYLAKYNDMFFEKNVLLLNSIYQSCGGGIMYQIDSVSYQGNQLKIEYSDMYEDDHSYPDVVDGLLAEITIPKEQYHAGSVVWEYIGLRSLAYTCELGEITPSEKFYDFANSTDAAAMINSADELEAYLTTIAEPETVQEYLIKYNEEFFAEKALLVRAFYTASSGDSFEVTGVLRDHDQITVNSAYQYGKTSDTLVTPYLAQVVLDRSDIQNSSLTWNVYTKNDAQQPDIVPFTYTSSIIESVYSTNALYNDYVKVYTNASELKSFLNSFKNQATDEFDVSAMLETYDEGYFAENVLILANVSLSTDGSLELVSVNSDDDYVEIEMRKISDGEEMRGQMALIEVPISCWTNRTPLISIL